jgi:DNA-3-methyladenine glycosylase
MRKILTQAFFNRPTLTVARELLGKYLVRKISKREITLKISEVEVYAGPHDRASHASRGRTERNKIMFGPAGIFYIYFTYGIHWMLNIVTGPKNYPAAILIRGTREISGPARLTKFLKITGKLNNKPAKPISGLWFEDRGEAIPKNGVKRTPRIGVDYAGPLWAKKLYRFVIKKPQLLGRGCKEQLK